MTTSLDHYRLLGRSGLRVSPVTLGTMTFSADWRWGADDGEAERIFAFSDEQLCRLNECSAVAPTFPGRLVDRPMTPQTNFRVGERGSPTRVGGTRMKLVRIDDAGRQARTWRGAGLAALRRRS